MSKNLIFVFTGTGNSLWVAKEIAQELENSTIISMGKTIKKPLRDTYDSIGFVFPNYAGGMPKQVKNFIENIDFRNNKDTYFYGVATCGKLSKAPNAIPQLGNILRNKGVNLNYGEKLEMFANCVTLYDMNEAYHEKNRLAILDLTPIIERICNHIDNDIPKISKKAEIESKLFQRAVGQLDRAFNVSDECVNCGICEKVCPVNNISYDCEGKPEFSHHCEQCVACIQNCPTRAINFGKKTQTRGRYTHPMVTWQDLAKLNGYKVEK